MICVQDAFVMVQLALELGAKPAQKGTDEKRLRLAQMKLANSNQLNTAYAHFLAEGIIAAPGGILSHNLVFERRLFNCCTATCPS